MFYKNFILILSCCLIAEGFVKNPNVNLSFQKSKNEPIIFNLILNTDFGRILSSDKDAQVSPQILRQKIRSILETKSQNSKEMIELQHSLRSISEHDRNFWKNFFIFLRTEEEDLAMKENFALLKKIPNLLNKKKNTQIAQQNLEKLQRQSLAIEGLLNNNFSKLTGFDICIDKGILFLSKNNSILQSIEVSSEASENTLFNQALDVFMTIKLSDFCQSVRLGKNSELIGGLIFSPQEAICFVKIFILKFFSENSFYIQPRMKQELIKQNNEIARHFRTPQNKPTYQFLLDVYYSISTTLQFSDNPFKV